MLNFPYLWDEGSLPEPIEIVTWADGTDAQIVAMVEAADRGDIELTDYWAVNDERTVSLAAMAASGSNDYGSWSVGETHAAQDVVFVLMNEGYPVVGIDNSHVHFVVGMKNCLNETGYMNSSNTNAGGWKNCARRGWCNSIFKASIPDTLRSIFKQFSTKTANGGDSNYSAVDTTQDYFALFSGYEVFKNTAGTGSYNGYTAGGGYALKAETDNHQQIKYYETSSNRIKQVNDNNSFWWERSPACNDTAYFCRIFNNGTPGSISATMDNGLAPFGCI